MEERKEGWYWVKMNKPSDKWRPDYYSGGLWRAVWSMPEDDSINFEIGPRIPTPDEPFKCAPVEPTTEMVDAASEMYMPFGDMAAAIQAAIVYAPGGEQ